MKKIIISINPTYVDKILDGTKKYEYRTKAAKSDVNKIIIYETTPVKRVVAEAEIIEVLKMEPQELWNATKRYAGTTKKFFDDYFKNREYAYAYKLGDIIKYKEPKMLEEFGLKYAPQSFAYVI